MPSGVLSAALTSWGLPSAWCARRPCSAATGSVATRSTRHQPCHHFDCDRHCRPPRRSCRSIDAVVTGPHIRRVNSPRCTTAWRAARGRLRPARRQIAPWRSARAAVAADSDGSITRTCSAVRLRVGAGEDDDFCASTSRPSANITAAAGFARMASASDCGTWTSMRSAPGAYSVNSGWPGATVSPARRCAAVTMPA